MSQARPPSRPCIVITVQAPVRHRDPAYATRRNDLYLDAVRRAGGVPLAIDETAGLEERQAAFTAMDGLLFSGGADVAPSRYGEDPDGTDDVEEGRDELEWQAWEAARERRRPVLGICRGLQVVNVFAGGRLIQHLDGHRGAPFGGGAPRRHRLNLDPGSRLAAILGQPGQALEVNSYHHQGVAPEGLAADLRASGLSPWEGPGGALVEALEAADPERFLFAVQCHPERLDSTPGAFARLFEAFVAASGEGSSRGPTRGQAGSRLAALSDGPTSGEAPRTP